MRIITDTETSILIAIGTFKEYWDNGYPIITDSNGNDCAYPTNDTTMYEVDSVPDGVEPGKYCYTSERGFFENPNYVEPSESDEYQRGYDDAVLDMIESGVL